MAAHDWRVALNLLIHGLRDHLLHQLGPLDFGLTLFLLLWLSRELHDQPSDQGCRDTEPVGYVFLQDLLLIVESHDLTASAGWQLLEVSLLPSPRDASIGLALHLQFTFRSAVETVLR